MNRRISLAVVCVIAVISFGAPLGYKSLALARDVHANPAQEKAAGTEIKIDNFSFTPPSLTVPVGTTVTWTNRDDIPHTVVSTDDPKILKSKALDTDEKFSFTFAKAGSYAYFCSIHPKMTGKVIVQ